MPINYNDYPPNWRTEIRPRILERDGHCCKHCGVPNYAVLDKDREVVGVGDTCTEARQLRNKLSKKEQRESTIIILTVAHLDHDEWNHEVQDDRLAALCQQCHLDYDREDNIRRKKYGRHYLKHLIPLFDILNA